MAVAVLAVIVLTLLLPHSLIVRPRWGVPIVECILLGAVIIADPGKIDRVSRRVRGLSITLIVILAATALWCTAQLIAQLIHGGPATQSGGALLAAGGIVYLSNCIAFALLYWELDSGGPIHRLPLPRFHQCDRLQPDRRDAAAFLEQDRHDGPVDDLAGAAGPRDRARCQRLDLEPTEGPAALSPARPAACST
jgi:hypothetical protein